MFQVLFKSIVLVDSKGFVALDEFAVVDDLVCATRPDQAAVSTLPPQTTTQSSGRLILLEVGLNQGGIICNSLRLPFLIIMDFKSYQHIPTYNHSLLS